MDTPSSILRDLVSIASTTGNEHVIARYVSDRSLHKAPLMFIL